jgi:CBS domain-containing protein
LVDKITLLPIGGIASMGSIPDKPKQEFAISIAGPLFNLSLASIMYFPVRSLLGREVFFSPLFSPGIENWPKTLAYCFWINPILGLFNLLPAFPMDGGRILRAFLARRMDYQRATRIAVSFGHSFAFLFAFVGIISVNFILMLIGLFIYMAASQEGLQVDMRMTLKRFRVDSVLPGRFLTVGPDTPLSKVLELIFHSHQEDFPVVEGEKLIGFLTRSDIISTIHQSGFSKHVGEIMRREFPTASIHDALTSVHSKLEESNLKAMPVLKDGRLYSIITLEDISRVYMMMSKRR